MRIAVARIRWNAIRYFVAFCICWNSNSNRVCRMCRYRGPIHEPAARIWKVLMSIGLCWLAIKLVLCVYQQSKIIQQTASFVSFFDIFLVIIWFFILFDLVCWSHFDQISVLIAIESRHYCRVVWQIENMSIFWCVAVAKMRWCVEKKKTFEEKLSWVCALVWPVCDHHLSKMRLKCLIQRCIDNKIGNYIVCLLFGVCFKMTKFPKLTILWRSFE